MSLRQLRLAPFLALFLKQKYVVSFLTICIIHNNQRVHKEGLGEEGKRGASGSEHENSKQKIRNSVVAAKTFILSRQDSFCGI